MNTFAIADGLTVDKHPQGAMVNYVAASGGDADVFHVGLSYRSLKACQKALARDMASWETSDGTFRVIKRSGEATLVFKMQGPPHESREIVLKGPELSKLEEAVAHLAAR